MSDQDGQSFDVESSPAEKASIDTMSKAREAKYDTSIPHEDDAASASNSCWSYFDLGFTSLAGKYGTYAGFTVLVLTMICSVITQAMTPEDEEMRKMWLVGCPEGYEDSCLANQAVMRYSFALVVLFGLNLILTLASAKMYDDYWALKILVFISCLVGFFYSPAHVFNNQGYAWFARIGGFLFIMLQQIILLDFALSWNEQWVLYSIDERKSNTISSSSLDRWQIAILTTGFGLLVLSITWIGIMFHHFGGCSDNDLILTLGIITSILGFMYQMKCTKIGSVLTSGVMSIYYAYICFSSVTLNPDTNCNPTLAQSQQTWTTVFGLAFTLISLAWTTYSTIKNLPAQSLAASASASASTGVHEQEATIGGNSSKGSLAAYAHEGLWGVLLSVSIIFILGSCYYAMVLTNWATQQANFSMGNSRIGSTAMWLQSSAGWCCFLMYIWGLTAPMIWPERFGLQTENLR